MTEQLLKTLAEQIKDWGRELGFQQVGITDCNLGNHEQHLKNWLDNGYAGDMQWIAAHEHKRSHPDALVPGTQRLISVRMDYLPGDTAQIKILKSAEKAYIARYALGRDYHKLVRKRLAQLAKKIEYWAHEHALEPAPQQRPFVDSAPVLEGAVAEKAGLGWIGKHTLLINHQAGSWFFLGELFTNLRLPVDNLEQNQQPNRCGDCTACLKVCPTDAFAGPYQLDARRCISYLTIENKGSIPIEFREPIGNRVFGCDDCQAICPWNKYAQYSAEKDFYPRHSLDKPDLLDLFLWDEDTYLGNTEGSALRRIGYDAWLRNLAIGLGNAPSDDRIIQALEARLPDASEMLEEHIQWALAQQRIPERKRKRKIRKSQVNIHQLSS